MTPTSIPQFKKGKNGFWVNEKASKEYPPHNLLILNGLSYSNAIIATHCANIVVAASQSKPPTLSGVIMKI